MAMSSSTDVSTTSENRWWSKDVVALVTGSNKGIGLEIVRQLAKKGITVVLTARNEERGLAAIELLKSQGLDVHFHPLDVLSTSSISQLASWLKQQFSGVDILINNAGVYRPEATYESVKEQIETNYEGVKRVTRGLLPIMKTSHAGSRIIIVSSVIGKLQNLKNASLEEELSYIEHLTEEKLNALVQRFLEDVKAGVAEEKGWPREYTSYSVSKMAVNAYARLLAKSLENRPAGQKVYVNCVCPGYCATDMTRMNNIAPTLTAEQGADTPVWLALLPPPGFPMGQFFTMRQSIHF